MGLARFRFVRDLAGFDFAVQPSVNRAQIRAIAIGWFIANGETVLFASALAPALVARLARAP